MKCIRETLPDTITLIGGPHPSTSRPSDLFVEFEGLLDYAIAGDGEKGLVELLDQVSIAGGKPDSSKLSDIPGLVFQNGSKACRNEPLLNVELDTLAPVKFYIRLRKNLSQNSN